MSAHLIAAIDRFEAALRSGVGPALDVAESRLLHALRELGPIKKYERGSEYAMGCTEGVSYLGTIYAMGHADDGRQCVILIRRVLPAVDAVPQDCKPVN